MTTTSPTTARRPVLITVLVVLVVLGGLGALLTAWIVFATEGSSVWNGVIQIAVAVAYLAVAKGLWNGNPTARFVAAAVAVVQIVLALLLNIGLATSTTATTTTIGEGPVKTIGIVFPILVLIVLFTPKANAFFGSRR